MSKDFFGEEEEDKILNDEEELFTLTDEDGNEIKFEFCRTWKWKLCYIVPNRK